jgi:uncharacterized membrane protein
MNDTQDSLAQPPTRRIRKRIGIPALFIGSVVVLLVWEIIRGNWTDSRPYNPASAADGVITQLLPAADGRKQIRAAVIVKAPRDRVWKVVTDYDHFSDTFPNISSSKGIRDPDGRWHVTALVHSMVWSWPMDIHVTHVESAEKSVASWDEPNGNWKVNRGSWVVMPHGSNETLLLYNLDLTVSPFPDFVVRAVLRDKLKPVLMEVARRAEQSQSLR